MSWQAHHTVLEMTERVGTEVDDCSPCRRAWLDLCAAPDAAGPARRRRPRWPDPPGTRERTADSVLRQASVPLLLLPAAAVETAAAPTDAEPPRALARA